MNIRGCLMNFAKIIGEDIKRDAISSASQVSDDFIDLVKIISIATRHLCLNSTGLEYVKKVKIVAKNKTIKLKDLNDKFFYVISILRKGKVVQYKFSNINRNRETIEVPEDGEYDIEYSSYPNFYNLEEEINIELQPYIKAIFLSACALWFLKKEQFTIYKKFHQEFIDEINSIRGEKHEGMGNKGKRK